MAHAKLRKLLSLFSHRKLVVIISVFASTAAHANCEQLQRAGRQLGSFLNGPACLAERMPEDAPRPGNIGYRGGMPANPNAVSLTADQQRDFFQARAEWTRLSEADKLLVLPLVTGISIWVAVVGGPLAILRYYGVDISDNIFAASAPLINGTGFLMGGLLGSHIFNYQRRNASAFIEIQSPQGIERFNCFLSGLAEAGIVPPVTATDATQQSEWVAQQISLFEQKVANARAALRAEQGIFGYRAILRRIFGSPARVRIAGNLTDRCGQVRVDVEAIAAAVTEVPQPTAAAAAGQRGSTRRAGLDNSSDAQCLNHAVPPMEALRVSAQALGPALGHVLFPASGALSSSATPTSSEQGEVDMTAAGRSTRCPAIAGNAANSRIEGAALGSGAGMMSGVVRAASALAEVPIAVPVP